MANRYEDRERYGSRRGNEGSEGSREDHRSGRDLGGNYDPDRGYSGGHSGDRGGWGISGSLNEEK